MKLLYMKTGFGYLTPKSVKFTKEHPYQLVAEEEIQSLLSEDRFRLAEREEVMEYYKLGELNEHI